MKRVLGIFFLAWLPALADDAQWVSPKHCPEVVIRASEYIPGYPYCKCLGRRSGICSRRGEANFRREQAQRLKDHHEETLRSLLNIVQPMNSKEKSP